MGFIKNLKICDACVCCLNHHSAVEQANYETNDCGDIPGEWWDCCAGVRWDSLAQTFTNPYPYDPAVFKFIGDVDDDFAYKRDSDSDWNIFEEGEHEFDSTPYGGPGLTPCNGSHDVNFCAQLKPGESIAIAPVNNYDTEVHLRGDVYMCKGTSSSAVQSSDDSARRMPSSLKRAANASRALVRSTVNVVRRKQPLLETSAEAARRLAICTACPKLDPKKRICTHANCGCLLRAKTYLRAERCPLDPPKW